jgi:5-methylcytosine-specific restriction endonuclease McrA
MNEKLTAKDRGLIKGAIRRAFARSALRRSVLDDTKISHSDPNRPRVKTWYRCECCNGKFAQYELEVDHVHPVVPVTKSLEEMSWDELIDRTWCDRIGLQVLCETCHDAKSAREREERKARKVKI